MALTFHLERGVGEELLSKPVGYRSQWAEFRKLALGMVPGDRVVVRGEAPFMDRKRLAAAVQYCKRQDEVGGRRWSVRRTEDPFCYHVICLAAS